MQSFATNDVTRTDIAIKLTLPRAAKEKLTTECFQRITMPPKSRKRWQSLEAAAKGREILKQARLGQDVSVSVISPSVTEGATSESHSETNQPDSPAHNKELGPFGLQFNAIASEFSALEMMGEFLESLVEGLDHEDRKSVSMLLCFVLVKELSFTETRAAELTAKVLNENNETVRHWRTDLVANGGSISENKQGRYQRTRVLWANEDLTKKASEYAQANVAVKGRPNLTIVEFCKWMNKILLPNSTLEPGFPRRIAVETARKWLHEMGFERDSQERYLE